MPVTIGEITTEVVLSRAAADPPPQGGTPSTSDELVDTVVRRALERVLERLRLEWER
jgi:hypothetical protein